MAILFVLLVNPSQALDNVPAFLRQWGGAVSGDPQFSRVGPLAIGPTGNVYTGDVFLPVIQVFSSQGVFLTKWGSHGAQPGQFLPPIYGIAVSRAGDVYVTNDEQVQRFTSTGSFIQAWGSTGSGPGQFSLAYGVAVDSKGFVYVADFENHRIQKFTADGTFVLQWGTFGSGNGQLKYPATLAFDSADNLYVGDDGNNRVDMFRSDSTFVRFWTKSYSDSTVVFADGLAADAHGHIYMTTYDYDRVSIFDTTGDFRYQWGGLGSGPGQFSGPIGVALDSLGDIYVADGDNKRVQEFAAGTVSVPSIGRTDRLSVSLAGNPGVAGSARLRVSGPSSEAVSVGVFDASGRRLWSTHGRTDPDGEALMPLAPGGSRLGAGVYFVRVEVAGELARTHFVVLR